MRPWLEDDEIAELCKPLEQRSARVRFLRRSGLTFKTKPNGDPIVLRSEVERVFGSGIPATAQNASNGQPDRAALLQLIQGGKRGQKAQGQ